MTEQEEARELRIKQRVLAHLAAHADHMRAITPDDEGSEDWVEVKG